MSNLAGMYKNDTANSPGIAVSVYISGCDLHCPGCHNQEAQNFDYGTPITEETFEEIATAIVANNINRSLCILGGEPLNPKNISTCRAMMDYCLKRYRWLKIYIWTGYTLKQLYDREENDDDLKWILEHVYCIIDGPYIESERDITLQMRGSRNQNVNYFTGQGRIEG